MWFIYHGNTLTMLDTRELPNFLRYPGGKRRMLSFLSEHIRPSDEIHGCYIEPFVGGGAVFFWLQPKRALLSDVNHELIDLYQCIRSNPQGVWKAFKGIPEGKETYNQMRKLRPSDLDPVMGAARLLYLPGLYRRILCHLTNLSSSFHRRGGTGTRKAKPGVLCLCKQRD